MKEEQKQENENNWGKTKKQKKIRKLQRKISVNGALSKLINLAPTKSTERGDTHIPFWIDSLVKVGRQSSHRLALGLQGV